MQRSAEKPIKQLRLPQELSAAFSQKSPSQASDWVQSLPSQHRNGHVLLPAINLAKREISSVLQKQFVLWDIQNPTGKFQL